MNVNSFKSDVNYFQPPTGNTEKYIDVKPVKVVGNTLSSYQALKEYSIRNFNKGFYAVEQILKHIFAAKLGKQLVFNQELWLKTVVVSLRCELRDVETGRTFDELRPSSVKDINPAFALDEGVERIADIVKYANEIKDGVKMEMPIYVSGVVLNYLGANVDTKAIFMVDGARRITACALNHLHELDIQLIILDEEYNKFLFDERVNDLRKRVADLGWFSNYQSIPMVGITGQRTLKRFGLMNMELLRDQVVMDFGCNTGQASINAVLAGARSVYGIEGMPDTLKIANDIKELTRFENINYLAVDFNDDSFDIRIDSFCQEKVDYSFFFSVYRTKELTQRDRLFKYIIDKTKKGIFFEGHAHNIIDTVEYYDWLFESFGLNYEFLGYSEDNIRPLFFLPLKYIETGECERTSISTFSPTPTSSDLDKTNDYLVSAIVSTYKSEKFIEGRLKDLLDQTLGKRLEIVVVDSNSPEDEESIVKRYMENHQNIKYIKTEERETVYKAWNRGIKMASGKYVTNANTDDRLRPDALEVLAGELDKESAVGLIYADFFITNFENMEFYGHIRNGYSIKPDYSPDIMLTGCHIGPQPMWRKALHNELGYFDENCVVAGDYEFWCRVAVHYPLKHIDEFLGLYLHNSGSVANSNIQRGYLEVDNIQKHYMDKFPVTDRKMPAGYYYKDSVVKNKFVNISMITFNRLEFTKKSIESIIKNTRFPYVLTVVDNNSVDGTKEYLQSLKQKGIIKNLLLLNKNIGPAKASNLAWNEEPYATYYLKCDNDIVITKQDWLLNMVKVVDDISEVGVVAYNVEPVSYPLVNIRGQRLRIKKGNLGGGCILIPIRTKKLSGYWCEEYGLYGEEDADYCFRTELAGLLNIYMEDEDMCFHLPAGKAAVVDPSTLCSLGGGEDYRYKDYRKWKDQRRRENVLSGLLDKNLNAYKNGSRLLFVMPERSSDELKRILISEDEISSGVKLQEGSLSPAVKVSIIIPVFNKIDYTRICLDTIYKNSSTDINFEVVVVDNGSTDGTSEYLLNVSEKLRNMRVVRNEENLGFAKANNIGVENAEGEFVLFLNNDTEPESNWIHSMLEVFKSKENVGIVGAKLLYTDGTIQHAGVMIVRDPVSQLSINPWHVGYRMKCDDLEFNHLKSFNAVTGACMLVKKEVFNRIGGFDEGYWNGYEDVDLCLKVIRSGYRIFYQPESVVIHHESKSGVERRVNEDKNIQMLQQRWGSLFTPDHIRIKTESIVPYNFASIVILAYNSQGTIVNCLKSVEATLRAFDEVILVDNCSSDNTLSIIEIFIEGKEKFQLVKNGKNIGFSAGVNVGIRKCKNPYIVLLNPDTIVTDNWLEHLINHFTEYRVAAVGPVSNYVAGKQKMEFYQKEDFDANTTLDDIALKFYSWQKGSTVNTKLLIGFCMVIRKDVFNVVGLFDEDLFLGNDDLEFCWRLRLNGFSLKVAVDTFIFHEGQKSFETEDKTAVDQLVQKSTDVLFRKLQGHYGKDKVPSPLELWGIDWFKPSRSVVDSGSSFLSDGLKSRLKEASVSRSKSMSVPLLSIIILTYNEIEHTKKCLLSIERHTHINYELIIVDNGSDNDNIDYLRNYISQHANVKVISNSGNKGFAFGNNQGISVADGKYLLLLNNDTVVTNGWIERMTAVFEREPKTGIVGPMSNYVSGLQLVSIIDYKSISEMDRFAADWAVKCAGKSIPVTHIVGFCLLMKREVVEQIGGLDTEFGSGNFEDDDYCLRASMAGYETRVAIDVFIHHTGSQTFRGANIDYQKSMLRNWEIFKGKWGIPAETQYERGFKRPLQLPQGVLKFVDLPDITLDHQQDINNNRWWYDISGAEP